MVDKEAIYDDLLKELTAYQYRLENPMPKPGYTEELMHTHFHNDAMFKRRVMNLVAGVMHILNRHL